MNTPSCRFLPLPIILFFAAPLSPAQPPPGASPLPEGIQKALNTPVWYLNYSVVVKLNGPRSELVQRTTTGTMILGLRSQSPSLSLVDGTLKPPGLPSNIAAQQAAALGKLGANASASATGAAASTGLSVTPAQVDQMAAEFDAFFHHYANWISGVNNDEEKTDAENEAELIRVRMENMKAHHTYRWQYSGPDHTGGTSQGWANGSGTVLHGHEPALELDGEKRRFKLLFAFERFGDSETTMKAVTGLEEIHIGTPVHERRSIEKALYPDHQTYGTITPALKITSAGPCFEGPIPANGGNLSYSSIHNLEDGDRRGTLALSFVLSPTPSQPAELIIIPPDKYQDWRPIAERSEKIPGDLFPIKLLVQKRGGGKPQFKANRFFCYLRKTSREKGVCMNWPPDPDLTLPFDLQFESEFNSDLLVLDTDKQEASILDSGGPTTEVNVSCFDYGAYGEFEVWAELENGEMLHGVVKGNSNEHVLKIPVRASADSNIAARFFKDHSLGALPDDDDAEQKPEVDPLLHGDGLTLYEEYRGFMHGDKWITADPKKKDVFVLNQIRSSAPALRGIKLFERVTGLKVHSNLNPDQVTDDMRINFNRTNGPHVVDQHVIRIKSNPAGVEGARVDRVGTPGTAKAVNMSMVWEEFRIVRGRAIPSFERTIAHEMLHSCNVYHHGEADKEVLWYARPPSDELFEVPVQINTYTPIGPSSRITVKTESGRNLTAADLLDPGAQVKVKIGVQHGQHSGAHDCIMRYWVAHAYPAIDDPTVRYLTHGEIRGTALCLNRTGTGINDAGRSPQSRYGDAAIPANGGRIVTRDRGDCLHQVRVNDFGEEPHRAPFRP